MRFSSWGIAFGLLFSVSCLGETLEEWSQNQISLSFKKIHGNISRPDGLPGSIVASPSKSEPNYYFHWVRDAGMTMDGLIQQKETQNYNAPSDNLFFDFIAFNRRLQ